MSSQEDRKPHERHIRAAREWLVTEVRMPRWALVAVAVIGVWLVGSLNGKSSRSLELIEELHTSQRELGRSLELIEELHTSQRELGSAMRCDVSGIESSLHDVDSSLDQIKSDINGLELEMSRVSLELSGIRSALLLR
jgi:hypothetical protein